MKDLQAPAIQTSEIPKNQLNQKYKKKQVFSFISNDNLSNFICIPLCGVFWVGGFLYSNQNKISSIELNLVRYITQIISTFIILGFTKQKIDFKKREDLKLLFIRGLISGGNGMAASIFQMYLPLTIYYTINSSVTIFCFLLNSFLYGIQFTSKQKKAVLVAIFGIGLVIYGRVIIKFFDSSYQFKSSFNYSSNELWIQIVMAFFVVIWSLVWAYGIVITSKHHSTFHQFILANSIIGLYMFSILQSTIPLSTAENISNIFTRKPEKYLWTFLYCGVPLAAANYIFNAGMFLSSNTGISTLITQINIFYVYLISTIKYNESINLICLLGAVLIIGSIYTSIFKK